MGRMSLPNLVPCIPVLSCTGTVGKSLRPMPLVESLRLPLSGLKAHQWDSFYHRMHRSPVRGIDSFDTPLPSFRAVWGV